MSSSGKQGSQYTERQQRVIAEIQRVAAMLGVNRLSQQDFENHHQLPGVSTAGYQFGSWNEAVQAAGLEPYPHGHNNRGPTLTDEELLRDIIRLHQKLGRPSSERFLASHGTFSPKPYRDRWGTWAAARAAAYQRYGVLE